MFVAKLEADVKKGRKEVKSHDREGGRFYLNILKQHPSSSSSTNLLQPPGVFNSLMADKNWMHETKRQHKLRDRVKVVNATEKLETLTNSLALIGETRVDEMPVGEDLASNLFCSSSETKDTVGAVL